MDTFLRSPVELPDPDRLELVTAFGLSLADGIVMYQVVKLAHWNVSGAGFVALHDFLGTVAGLVDSVNDKFAERIPTLGALIGANVERVGEVMRLKDYPITPMGPLQHVREVCDRLDVYLRGAVAACEIAKRVKDEGSVQRIGTALELLQEAAWKLVKEIEPQAGPAGSVVTVP